MNYSDSLTAIIFFSLLTTASVLLGRYMAAVFSGERTFMTPLMRPIEKIIYRICLVDEAEEYSWKRYALGFILFNITGVVVLIVVQMAQGVLPLNPARVPGVRWDTAFNTAVSFVTNTNWQSYVPESGVSYLTQMSGLAVQNFLSAAIGMAVALPLVRSFIRRESATVGNLWVDMTRSVLYVLLPLSVIVCILLLSQGVVQSINAPVTAETLEHARQVIPLGPAASQVAIKQLGSNGGGFFNANSAHPFENPTFLTNLVETFAILLIPMAFVFMFGFMIKNARQGRALFFAMLILFILGLGAILYSEQRPNPALENIGLAGPVNMEGKETRLGIFWSVLWSGSTTATSNGSVNAMHDSFMPLGGLVQMFNIGIGEVIFGGVGVGLIGMLFYVILAMFVAGLMIGRTPEFLGKKLGSYEMIMAMISMLLPMMSMVIFSAVAISTNAGLSGLNNPSSHGLSEILYAYSSGHGNNGSAFAGLGANTVFYNITIGIAMFIGRFATILPALAVAGSLARQKIVPASAATFPTTGVMFIVIVISVIFIMGALTFFPVYSLGPILEHFFVTQMKLF
ncbi:MAG TPA: potassium-transporting ATPase subunit KdpA [Spirochaetota bacterium]|nr:potassium-transporting ATPase subunit KdpA [Spirochaetota bacterium]HOD14228.1 potassium-transporting ATPase subunit KdpA [Spirochaetota bacterium]HPG51287.1 potassium-transporting ATPase subunit KdpA [Spirochaetota bacterium]HQL83517.1 potassium-transporting ATPase subunit KdpA [Spirochaetota bacterium]